MKMSPSETDPLLPQGNSAPEITGYGFSPSTKTHDRAPSEDVDEFEDVEDKSKKQASQRDVDFSPLRIIIALFVIVVSLAIFITLFLPGTWKTPWRAPHGDDSSIQKRVDRILVDNPLIGS